MITKEQLTKAIEFNFSEPNKKAIDSILIKHQEAKKDLLDIMGDWILDFGEIEIEPTEADIYRGYEKFIYDIKSLRNISPTKEDALCLQEVLKLIILNKDGFFENKVVVGPKTGTKLTRAIGQLLKDKPVLANDIQVQFSRRKPASTKGVFKMSIHGMDYLTMSENNYDWHSCMSLDGEYSSGTLSYMCDTCTVILYLDGSYGKLKSTPCCIEPWNNKKWRMVANVDLKRRCIYLGGKQYPCENPALYNIAVEKLKEVFFPDAELIDTKHPDNRGVFKISYEDEGGLHYNDFCKTYIGRNEAKVLYTKDSCSSDNVLTIGSNVPCLCCGEGNIETSETWTCYNCSGYVQCECCKEYFQEEELSEGLCESCLC